MGRPRRRADRAALVAAALLLAACETRMIPTVQRLPPVAVPTVQPLTLSEVTWSVTPDTDAKGSMRFSLDEQGYRAFAMNMVEIQRYLQEQNALIAFLRKVLDDRSASAEDKPAAEARR